MKTFTQFFAILSFLLGITLQNLDAQVAVTGVSLNKTTLILNLYESAQLTATISPSNATNQTVSWTSSNSSIVTVYNDGQVSASHDGVATVTVTTDDGNYTASCEITVKDDQAANIDSWSFSSESHQTSLSDETQKVTGFLPYGTDPSNLSVSDYQITPGASIVPLPETVHDYSDTVQFVVTSPDGTTQKTWKVSAMVLPDLRGTQKVELTFSTAPQGWIDDTVSWEESNIHFHIDYPNPADDTWPPSAAVGRDEDYSHKMGISLFPAKLRFYLEDTNKVIVAASMYIFENCADSCTYASFFGIGGYHKEYIDKMTREFHFINLKNVKAEQGIFQSSESSFSGITFWLANKDGSVNHQPVADAGPNQTVYSKDTVQLDGSASMDPDHDALSYAWLAPQGIILNNSSTVNPTFIAPNSMDTLHLHFTLTVTDHKSDPVADEVIITVIPTNHAPVADAGPNQTVAESDSVYLDGSASSDPDGDPLTYLWLAPGGIHLTDSTSATPAFKAPDVDQTTTFSFGLIVNDGLVNSTHDTVLITVENINHRPIAWIDMDQIQVDEGDSTYVEGHYSYDPDGDSLRFHWWAQDGSGIGFFDSTAMDVRIGVPMVDHDTTFEVYVKVSDGQLFSEPDTAYIHIMNFNSSPVAILQKHTSPVFDGDTVYLDGSSSYDADGDSLTYKWSGPKSVYLNKEGDSAWFVAPIVKTTTPFVFTLVVNDGHIDSPQDIDTIWVNHINHAPVAQAGYPITMFENDSSYLYGSLSYDYDGDSLSYSWKTPAGFWIADSTQADSRFVAPQVQHDTTFSLVLTVFDGQLYSSPDTCRVTVKNTNQAPVAAIVSTSQIFHGVTVNEGDTLWIDGSPSYDPDGDPITYDWAIPKAFDYYHYDSVKVMIVAPEVQETTSYDAALFVSDPTVRSAPDNFIIQVINGNKAPVADAGKDFSALSGRTVQLKGSGSYDADGDSLSYTWTAPTGIVLDDVHAVSPTFTAPDVTSQQTLTFQLVVNDGVLNSNIATVNVVIVPLEAVLQVSPYLNDSLLSVGRRHVSIYYNDAGRWTPQNVLSYEEAGESYFAVWPGQWMISVDPLDDSAGFVSTFSGDVPYWAEENAFQVTAGQINQQDIHLIAVAAQQTGDGSIGGAIYHNPDTITAMRNSIEQLDGGQSDLTPAEGVSIFLYQKSNDALLASRLTDKEGKFRFDNLPNAVYYLSVQLPGYDENEHWDVTVSDDQTENDSVNFVINEGTQTISDVDEQMDMNIHVYPNPTSGQLYITRDATRENNAELHIYSVTGKLMIHKKLKDLTNKIDVSHLTKGLYFIRISSQNSVITRKFIKQ